MTSSDILQWDDTVAVDEGIEEYEFRRYPPNAGGVAMLNQAGPINFSIESGDIFTHIHRSYLQFSGTITKQDGTRYLNADKIALANNAMMHLFNQIRLNMGGQEIETIQEPGQATAMIGTLEYVDDFEVSRGLSMCWFKDNYTYDENGNEQGGPTVNNSGFKSRHDLTFALYQDHVDGGGVRTPNEASGNFTFNVPLSHIFGFCKDYDKVIYGVKQELTLTRKADNSPIYRDGAVDPAKLTLNNIYWFVPIVKPSISNLNTLMGEMAKNINIKMPFDQRQVFTVSLPKSSSSYTWNLTTKAANEKPRFLVVAFQVGDRTTQTADPSTFDNINVNEMHVYLNNVKRYPALDFFMDFDKNNFMDAFNAAINFPCLVNGVPSCISNSGINPLNFCKLYPLFVFDLSKQSATLKSAITNITVEMKFKTNTHAVNNTQAFGVLLSDKVLNFQSDGKQIRQVF